MDPRKHLGAQTSSGTCNRRLGWVLNEGRGGRVLVTLVAQGKGSADDARVAEAPRRVGQLLGLSAPVRTPAVSVLRTVGKDRSNMRGHTAQERAGSRTAARGFAGESEFGPVVCWPRLLGAS